MPIRSRISLYLLLLSSLALFACHAARTLRPDTARQQVEQGLALFHDFRLDGLIEVQAGGFSLRKDMVLFSEPGAVQVDVIDKGILGMMPTPLFHFRADSVITLQSSLPIGDRLEIGGDWKSLPREVSGVLLAKSDSIAVYHRCHYRDIEFSFDADLRIVKASGNNLTLYIQYRDGEFDRFRIDRQGKNLAIVTVYKITRGRQT